jgi:ADP-ribosyl-[dinitrogen reductase] hydrolase
MNTNENAVGAVVGAAIGDALGAGYEFGPAVDPALVGMIGGGGFQWEPGEWTDDTQMANCVLTALVGGADPTTADGQVAVAEQFLSWYRSHPKDVGNQTRAVIGNAGAAVEIAAFGADYTRRNPNNAAGNGSLMRAAVVALRYLDDRAGCAIASRAVSDLTHPDLTAGDACVLWTEAVRLAVVTNTLDLRAGLDLLPAVRRDQWSARIQEAEDHGPARFSASQGRGNGYVVHAFQCAWSAIHRAFSAGLSGPKLFDEAVRSCVAAGDDADTTAAICGGLIGAYVGVSAIPVTWLSALHGWPGWTYNDLMRRALIVSAHSDLEAAWFDEPLIVALKPAFTSALPSDAGVMLGNADSLIGLDDSVAVVSLCRLGTDQVRAKNHAQVWLSDSLNNRYAREVLAFAADQVHEWRQQGLTVLVHCAAGESRTPAVAAVYLARHLNASPADAYREAHNTVGNIRRDDSAFRELIESSRWC